MIDWTRPIFGKKRDETPLSPAGERAARLVVSRQSYVIPAMMCASVLGVHYWIGTLGLAYEIAIANLARRMPAGGVPPRPSLVVRAFDAIVNGSSSAGGIIVGIWVVYFGLACWVGPKWLRWNFDRSAAARSIEGRLRARRRRRPSKRTILAVYLFVAAVAVGATFVTHWAASVLILGKSASIGGACLLAAGLWHRTGTQRVCSKCDYAMGSWRSSPDRCPECGQRWHEPWKATLGIKCVNWRFVLLGAGILLAVPLANMAAVGSLFSELLP